MNTKNLFQEQQKFTQWWLWLLLLPIFAIVIYSIWIGRTASSSNMLLGLSWSDWLMILMSIGICALFFLLNLKTTITKDTIKVQYFPFFKKQFAWTTIAEAELVQYGFVGYGIRISMKYGTVYNVKGNKGLAIILNNGKKYLIGTQKSDQIEKILKEHSLSL